MAWVKKMAKLAFIGISCGSLSSHALSYACKILANKTYNIFANSGDFDSVSVGLTIFLCESKQCFWDFQKLKKCIEYTILRKFCLIEYLEKNSMILLSKV